LQVLAGFVERGFTRESDGTYTPQLLNVSVVSAPLAAVAPVCVLGMQECTGRLHARVNSDLSMTPAPAKRRRTDTASLIDVSFTLRRTEAARGVNVIDAALCRTLHPYVWRNHNGRQQQRKHTETTASQEGAATA
jgi:hypothetical protein